LSFDTRRAMMTFHGLSRQGSDLGAAYSLGSEDSEESGLLAEKLKRDLRWTPHRAFTLILFTMPYVSCFATFVAIKKGSSLKWVGFSVAFDLIVAYGISFTVYQDSEALGPGV
jgi:Fe2+ transport system protein B